MGKQIHTLTLTKDNNQIKFGFRIIGGKDEGQTFKVLSSHFPLTDNIINRLL